MESAAVDENIPLRRPAFWPLMASSLAAGALLLIPGGMGLYFHQPWLFPSLGPTAFLIVVAPRDRATRFFTTVAGHLIGILAAWVAIYLLVAAGEPSLLITGDLYPRRMAASCVAVFLTLLGQQWTRTVHVPAAATTLLFTLGAYRTGLRDGLVVVSGVLLLAGAGIPVRWWMARIVPHPNPGIGSPK